jgi:predicted transcriptional regulator
MKRRVITEKHSMSLRLPIKWHELMEQQAERLNTTTSFIYRIAIAEFIEKQNRISNENRQDMN